MVITEQLSNRHRFVRVSHFLPEFAYTEVEPVYHQIDAK